MPGAKIQGIFSCFFFLFFFTLYGKIFAFINKAIGATMWEYVPSDVRQRRLNPRSLIRDYVVRIKKLSIFCYQKCAQWRFWSDRECAGWSESSLGAYLRFFFFFFFFFFFLPLRLIKHVSYHIVRCGSINTLRLIQYWRTQNTSQDLS